MRHTWVGSVKYFSFLYHRLNYWVFLRKRWSLPQHLTGSTLTQKGEVCNPRASHRTAAYIPLSCCRTLCRFPNMASRSCVAQRDYYWHTAARTGVAGGGGGAALCYHFEVQYSNIGALSTLCVSVLLARHRHLSSGVLGSNGCRPLLLFCFSVISSSWWSYLHTLSIVSPLRSSARLKLKISSCICVLTSPLLTGKLTPPFASAFDSL